MAALAARFKKEIWYVLFLVPGLALFCLSLLIPLFLGIGYSFTNWDGVSPTQGWVGPDNYTAALGDPDLWTTLGNTFQYAIVLTVLANTAALILALVLDARVRFRNVFRAVFFLPGVLSVVLAAFVWNYNYSFGLSSLGQSMGFDWGSPLGNPDTALMGLILIALWQGLGSPMLIYIAGLQGIPGEMIEAATMDGAGRWRLLTRIKLPLIAPAVTINMVLVLTGALKVFDLVFVTTNGGPAFATQVMSTYIYRTAFTSQRGGYGMALSMIFFVVLLAVTVLQLAIFRRKEIDL
jgi:raffinose/stachyose/melibiose transport system permease protein